MRSQPNCFEVVVVFVVVLPNCFEVVVVFVLNVNDVVQATSKVDLTLHSMEVEFLVVVWCEQQ